MMGLFWGGTDRCNIFVKKTSRDSGVLGRGRVGCLATGFAHTVPDGRTVKGEGGEVQRRAWSCTTAKYFAVGM